MTSVNLNIYLTSHFRDIKSSETIFCKHRGMDSFVTTLRRARVKRTYLSPTRRHNPQPLGLVYQSPLHPNAPVCMTNRFILL